MSIIAWLLLGAVAGWIASIIAGCNGSMGAVANIIVGVGGALLGGLVFNFLGGAGVTGLNIWSLMVAVTGAVILLTILRLFDGGQPVD